MLRTGDRDALCERLIRGGYRAVSQVIEHGDYALRGSATRVPLLSASPKRCSVAGSEMYTSIAPLSGSSSVTLTNSAGAPCPLRNRPLAFLDGFRRFVPAEPDQDGSGPRARRRVGTGGRHLSTRTGSTRPKAPTPEPQGHPERRFRS